MTGRSFHYRQPWLVLDAVGPLWAENKLCHDNTAWWDSKSWNSEKPSTASPRSLRVKRMNPRSSLRGLAESWAEMCSGFREGKLKRRKHETLQLSPFASVLLCLCQRKYATPNISIFFGCWLYQSNPDAFLIPKKSSSAFDALGFSCCWVDVCTWLVPDSLSGGFGACPAAEFAAANGSLTFL